MASRQSRNLAVGMKPKLTKTLSYVDITPSRIKIDVVTPGDNHVRHKISLDETLKTDNLINETNPLLFLASCFMMTSTGKMILLSVK